MSVIVNAGFAMVNGCMKLEESQRTLFLQAADTAYDRIDTVVMRLNDNVNARYCDLYVIEGVPALSPVRPTLNRSEAVWELGLADIFVPKSSGAVSNQRITDTRYETERCGIISSISQFDTTTLYQQIQADLAGFKEEEQADFIAWFEQIKDQLSSDAAGHLQNEIDQTNGVVSQAGNDIEELRKKLNDTIDIIGNLEELKTEDKNTVVSSLNELFDKYTELNSNLKAVAMPMFDYSIGSEYKITGLEPNTNYILIGIPTFHNYSSFTYATLINVNFTSDGEGNGVFKQVRFYKADGTASATSGMVDFYLVFIPKK